MSYLENILRLSNLEEEDIIKLTDRHVKTAEGAKKFNRPIGALISNIDDLNHLPAGTQITAFYPQVKADSREGLGTMGHIFTHSKGRDGRWSGFRGNEEVHAEDVFHHYSTRNVPLKVTANPLTQAEFDAHTPGEARRAAEAKKQQTEEGIARLKAKLNSGAITDPVELRNILHVLANLQEYL